MRIEGGRMSLQQALINELKAAGASLVSFADMSDLPKKIRHNLPRAISIATAFDPSIIATIRGGPNPEYDAECVRIKDLMNALGDKCVSILEREGYNAVHESFYGTGFSFDTISTPLPHKTAATRAGLGWIGKCCLLVTEDYGPAVCLLTVHTNGPLPTAAPVKESRCGDCAACEDVCPVKAPLGNNWNREADRESFFDVMPCLRSIEKNRNEFGYQMWACGMCVAACPYTQNYIKCSGVK